MNRFVYLVNFTIKEYKNLGSLSEWSTKGFSLDLKNYAKQEHLKWLPTDEVKFLTDNTKEWEEVCKPKTWNFRDVDNDLSDDASFFSSKSSTNK